LDGTEQEVLTTSGGGDKRTVVEDGQSPHARNAKHERCLFWNKPPMDLIKCNFYASCSSQ
jgi:hypothetical protein